jgi:hypothetical protein
MWTDPQVFFWPFFGWEVPSGETPFWPLAWDRAWSDPWRWALGLAGLGYLSWLWFALGLNEKVARRVVVRTGRLPEYKNENA